MEEAKAAAYYDELTRKGEGAARFKQGLGFSSSSAASDAGTVPSRGSAFNSPSSFLSSFVRASSPSKAAAAAAEFQKQKQLESIQNKLRKKPDLEEKRSRVSEGRGSSRHRDRSPSRERRSRRRSRSRDRRRDRSSSRERDRDSDRRRRGERRRRSRSRSVSDEERGQRRGRERKRSRSPRSERLSERGGRGDRGGDGGGSKVDYSKMIEGYEKMSAAERVKAKMKLQLSETAKKDTMISMGTGWERFEFDKDAPLDDEEVEAAEDDTMVVKQMGQSFRFSAVEAKKEEQIKAAHDKAMFGAPALPMFTAADGVEEQNNDKKEATESAPVSNLMSEKVLAKQKGSWRDRARKL